MNTQPNLNNNEVCHETSTSFVRKIKVELEGGRGFAPFVGSGISALSGILMSQDFSNYLAFCVWKVLGSPSININNPDSGFAYSQPWDLANAGWPPYPSSNELVTAKTNLYNAFKILGTKYRYNITLEQDSHYLVSSVDLVDSTDALPADTLSSLFHLRRPLVPYILRSDKMKSLEESIALQRGFLGVQDRPWGINHSVSSKSHIEEKAIRALSHWTLTLEFLASTRVDTSKTDHLLYLTDCDTSIIDSFNQHITRGKHPNLIHNLLARLARSLRTRVILSTNFDTLLEQAFASQGNPISVLSVSTQGSLPAYSTVRAQDCMIKLHGDLLETRADSSINTPPQEQDKHRFFQYLRGPEHPHHKAPAEFVPSHLLVLGYSASDARCVQMIKYVLDLDKDFKVFWICHTKYDHQNINTIFRDYIGKDNRFHIVTTDRSDLLLWELYQVINLSLPGGGYCFKFTHHVPPVLFKQQENLQAPASIVADLKKEIEQITSTGKVVSINYSSGVIAIARELFQEFALSGRQALWFELDDYSNALDFVWETLGAISLRRGTFYAEAVNFMPHELLEATNHYEQPVPKDENGEYSAILAAIMSRIELLCSRYRIDPENWVLFLYGRNGLGCSNGWKTSYWNEDEQNFFAKILISLAEYGFRIVYMPYGKPHDNRNMRKVELVAEQARKLMGYSNMTLENHVRIEYPSWNKKFRQIEMPDIPAHKSYDGIISLPEPASNPYAVQSGVDGNPSPFESILQRILLEFCHIDEPEYTPARSARILWLYGLTLFRQSRNSTSMISEAVFPCPWKFNIGYGDNTQPISFKLDSWDNDEIRFRGVFEGKYEAFPTPQCDDASIMGWSRWLERCGFFLYKPGGFYWIYRDIRVAIQNLLELIGPIPLYTTPISKVEYKLPDLQDWRSMKEMCPRIHYWIAEWYLKAFHSTGHYMPLVEAIYHAASSIQFAPDYVAPKITDKKRRIAAQVHVAWSSLCLLRQALRDGRKCFLYWCPGINIEKTFFGDVGELRGSVKNLCDAAPGSDLAKRLKHDLMENGLLESEIKELKETVIAEGYAHLRKPLPSVRRMDPSMSDLKFHVGSVFNTQIDTYKSCFDDDAKWKTSVVSALRGLFKINNDHLVPIPEDNPDDSLEFHQTIRDLRLEWTMKWDEYGANFDDLYELAWGLSSMTYDFLRRAKIIFHNSDCDLQKPKPLWGQICVLAYHGLLLCRLLPPHFEARQRELRVRLLSTYGLAHGCLGRCWESNRRFHEAHALALSHAGDTLPLQRGRIQLRCAEMYLYRASKAYEEYKTGKGGADEALLKSAMFVHIDDAWAAIERGESALSGRNHSSFWWYRVAVTKLSCLAALANACVISGSKGKAALPLRRRQHLTTSIEALLMEAIFAANGDDFRSLRAMEYAQRASKMPGLIWLTCRSCTTLADKYAEEIKVTIVNPLYVRMRAVLDDSSDDHELLKNYRTKVREAYNYKGK